MQTLSDNARTVLEARYLRRDSHGEIIETPEGLFRRVADAVAEGERSFGGAGEVEHWREVYFDLLTGLDFVPNSPTLMNAGTPLGQLSACFVLPVEDRLEAIFEALKWMALVQQSGGGTGFSFSRLRPRGDVVMSTSGSTSGPVSFMHVFDTATENIRQGGRRRGANMGILRVDHPDVVEFIEAKLDEQRFQNFNLSVAVTDEFMEAVADDRPFELRHPTTREPMATVSAVELFERATEAAWRVGDPGLIFLDAINRANPTPQLGDIEATNPCGEVPLLPNEACTLGSIHLGHMVRRTGASAELDQERLAATARVAVRFLDDVIEVGRWPTTQIAEAVRGNRKIGLGVMGFADLLIELGVSYASPRALELADQIMSVVGAAADEASEQLAEDRGVFPHWSDSVHAQAGRRLRNATRTSIAPTGTISIIADTSASLEPLFALAYRRENVLDGRTLWELNPLFMEYARREGFHSPELEEALRRIGSLEGIPGIPSVCRELFRTALEIDPLDHLRVQRAFQARVDNAVSKTINLPETATSGDIASIYRQAWEWGLKGITVYRYGSKNQQVLHLGELETPVAAEHFVRCDPEGCQL